MNFSKRHIIFWITIWMVFSTLQSQAQKALKLDKDTFTGPFLCHYYTENNIQNKVYGDTNIQNSLQWFNYIQQDGLENNAIGSVGSSVYTIRNNSTYQKGFQLRKNTHFPYALDVGQVKYFTTNKPFVELNFNFGANGTLIVDAVHGQNINKHISVGIEYRRIASLGAFANGQSLTNNTSLYFRWSSKNYRYYNTLLFILNDIRNQENGGLATSDINSINNGNKSFLPTKLISVSNFNYNTNWNLDQVYILKRYQKDTLSQNFYGNDYARVQLSYTNELNRFYDARPDSLYYSNFNYKSGIIENKFYNNKIGLKTELNIGIIHNKLQFNPYMMIEKLLVNSGFTENNHYKGANIFVGAKINFKDLTAKVLESIEVVKGIAGYNLSDLMFTGKGNLFSSLKWGKLLYQVQFARKAPTYVQNNFYGNTWNYENNFVSTNNLITAIQLHINKVGKHKLSASYEILGHYIYLDSSGQYRQRNDDIQLFSFGYSNQISTKHFGWKNEVLYQICVAAELPTMPVWIKSSIYYQGYFFKRNLQMQIGMDVRYNGSFKVPIYSVFYSDFAVQSKVTTNSVPVADVFINARIKTVEISIKYNDALNGLLNRVNYNALNYPFQGRGMDLFIKWRFLN